MQRLVGHFLGYSRVQLYLEFDRPLEDDELVPIRDGLKRRGQGIPLQHILGEVEFLRRDFLCDGRGLIPRPETEELVSLILKEKETLPDPLRILDVGTGSGVIGLSLAAELPSASETVLSDSSPDALELARENANRLEVEATFVASHLFDDIPGNFSLIVANLPYVPEKDRAQLAPELAHDPAAALFSGADGLDLIREFIPVATTRLTPGGLLAMEIGHDQGKTVAELLTVAGLTEVDIKADLSGVSRFPFARKR
jgi:release factor glutamine methyltransferase